jgi:hypothetical protein
VQAERNLEQQWAGGHLQHGNIAAWHWDNTEIDRLYACT